MKIYSKICFILLTLAFTVSAAFAQEGKTPPKTKHPIVKVEKEKNDREQQERQKQEEQRRQKKERNEPQ